MAREGRAQCFRAGVGIAIHVAANPRSKVQDRSRGHLDVIDVVDGFLQLFVKGRDDAIDDIGEVEEHILQFVHDGGTRGGLRIGLPGRGDFLADSRQRGALFVGRAGRIEPLHEQAADHLFLFEQRAPRCFSRMRGKYRLDPESLEESRDLRRGDIRRGQATRGGLQTAFLRIAGATQIVAAAPDAMNSLGEVDDLEVGGERAD